MPRGGSREAVNQGQGEEKASILKLSDYYSGHTRSGLDQGFKNRSIFMIISDFYRYRHRLKSVFSWVFKKKIIKVKEKIL